MKSPIPWLGQCFMHVRSDDLYDHYDLQENGASNHDAGYLTHSRTGGAWLASLRGSKAVSQPEYSAHIEDNRDTARRALNEALAKLRARVEDDRKWLAMIDEEIG